MSNEYKCQSCKKLPCDNYFRLKKCSHIFCHECLCKYIEVKIDKIIKCPICPGNISDQIIRRCLSNADIRKYESICINSSNPKARKCLTQNCHMIKVIENDNVIYHCDYCNQPNCLKCKKRHYPNQCGLNISEDNINIAATEAIKIKKQEELKELGDLNIIPNPDKFECCLCNSFILPREGLITRNCHHTFCKSCFNEAMKNVTLINNFKCPQCEQNLNHQEIKAFIDLPDFSTLNCKPVAPKMFCCKFPNCEGMWDKNNVNGFYVCPVCKHKNCLECEGVHESQSCEKYRNSKMYKQSQEAKLVWLLYAIMNKKLQEIVGRVKCLCGAMLIIAPGGCGAIYCTSCGRQVCQFTGKLAGNTGPNSCGCTTTKTCHKDCLYGCLPENPFKKYNQNIPLFRNF